METLLKWLNKPKADDKSLLARFFHADRALTAVASELDSFDGRAEPDRCSRLVSRLRQGQDKVLAITNLIIEELLGDERDQRAFRAKFPEEVLQENLAGQLWFGAECLAAGSSIMNREQESKEMRPLAEAVTRSLNNVRYLLRDQCLRNNVPNSERLNLDKNDAATEQLYESLKRFDRLFAEFEWRYVSAMVQVKSKEEYEMQELICVLCSETLQRALKLGLLEQEKVDAFDPALMFSIPRLAIVSGLVIYPDGPLNMDMPAEQLSEMFRPFRSILLKVRDYLRNLNETELYYLERLLCTNEEISLKDTLNAKDAASVVADNNNSKSSKYSEHSPAADDEGLENASSLKTTTTTTSKLQQKSTSTSTTTSTSTCKTFKTKPTRRADSPSPAPSTTSSSSSDECSPYNTPVSSTPSSPRSSHSLVSTSSAGNDSNGTTSPDSWIDDDNENDVEEEEDDDDDEEDLNDNFLAARDEDDHYADDDDSDVNSEEDDDDDDEVNKNLKYMTDEENINLELVSADCNTGYLISNTTLGNLLQPQEVPLTDNFIVSVSDLPSNTEDSNDNLDLEMPTTSAKLSNVNTSRQEQEQLAKENHVNNNSANTRNRSYLAGDLIDDITSNYLIHMAYADDSDLEGTIREINQVTEFHEDCNDNVDLELPSTSTKLVKNTSTSRQGSKSTSCVQDSSLGDNYIPTSDCHDECSTTNAGDSDLEDNNINVELPSTSDKLLNVASAATKTSRENSVDALIECSTTNPSSDLHCAGDSDLEGTTTTSTSTSSCTRRRHYSNDLIASTQSQSQCQQQQQQQQQLCTKDHTRSHRHHHHRHHHHHHHHNHHNNHHTHTTSASSTNNRSNTNNQHQSNQSHHRHRGHHVHNHGHSHGHNHGHGHHHRRPNRHGGDKQQHTLTRDECIPKEDSTMENSKATSSIGVLDIETPSSSSSLMEDNKTVARSSGRSKFKHTENLLHRLFVCIAGVADQLQTNFAFDLRQILRSVFLMNMSPALEELDIPEKPKDNELFEFRASENDVIQESAGSSQSIYSAEEVNPEGDNQSNSSSNSSSSSNTSSGGSNEGNRAYRHSTGTTTITTTTTATTFNENDGGGVIAVANVNQRQQIERSRSLDNQDCNTTTIVAQTQQQQRQNPPSTQQQQLRHNQHVFRNRYNSTGSNSPSISSSENSSPICERSTNTTNRRVSESNANLTQSQHQQQQQQPTSPVHLSPPAWIPDQKAPRCMSCNTPFTAFRRRHHCRNCGGVFCGVCSNNSTPLPKYGLTKAVRVCRSCYIHELTTSSAINNHHHHHPHNNQHHNHNHHNYHSQLVSQTTNTTTTTNTTNNEPRLRRPVTTTRAID